METETTQTTRAGLTDLANIISALALHASTDTGRQTLCAIYLTSETMTATNSYTLAQWTPTEPITTGEPALINARELTTALNNLTKAAKQYRAAQVNLTIHGGHTWRLEATTGDSDNPQTIGNYNGQTITGEYPNTNQLLETAACGQFEPTGYDPALLETITKASRKISKQTPLIMAQWINPQKPTLFTTTTEQGQLKHLLMPQRINTK
jgi:hypothetical protein